MTRGILAATLLTTAITAVPAQAASPYVAYEAVRVKPGGASQVPFRVTMRGPGLFTVQELEPRDGGGYQRVSVDIQDIPSNGSASFLWLVHPKTGHRFIVSGPRAHLEVIRLSGYMKHVPIAFSMRTVTAAQADEDVHDVAGEQVRVFTKATTTGGRYGSLAFAWVPCDAGQWTFGSDAEPGTASPCLMTGGPAIQETYKGRRWTSEGPLVGTSDAKYRLLVVDYPKR